VSPLAFVIALLALAASVRTRVTVAGQPVPVLWLLAAIVTLLLAVVMVALARLLIRDGLRLRPGKVTA
jgi:hypothetical protein